MNFEDAKTWAIQEIEYLDRRIAARAGASPKSRLSGDVLLGLIEARGAIELLLQIAALHTEGVAGLADLRNEKEAEQKR